MRNKYFLLFCSVFTAIVSYSQVVVWPGDQDPIPSNETPIGKTEGSLNVNLAGAAIYTVPIQVPKGVNGVEPAISLAYNSQAANGIVGLGWSISGISTISRVPSTLYHDGKKSAVDFSASDRFALDGQRLLLKSGTYGGDGAEYQTENYSNLKITSHGISPYGAKYGPKYFKVQYPDGSVATYGNTDNSRSKLVFGIDSLKDTSNNYLVYKYEEKEGTLFISSIQYVSRISSIITEPVPGDVVITPRPNSAQVTGSQQVNIDVKPPFRLYDNEVKFYYDRRNDVTEELYIGGQKFSNNQILSKIETISGGQVFRSYQLEYDKLLLGYSQLKSIKEFNGMDEKSLAPLEFVYDRVDGKVKSTTQLYTRVTNSNLEKDVTAETHDIVTGDFDGDGDLDYILYDKKKAEYWVFNTSVNNQKTGTYKMSNSSSKFKGFFRFINRNQNNEVQPKDSWLTIVGNKFTVNKFDNNIIVEDYFKEFGFPDMEAPDDMYSQICGGVFPEPTKDFFVGDFKGTGDMDVLAIERYESARVQLCDRYDQYAGTYPIYSEQNAYFLNMNRNETEAKINFGFVANNEAITTLVQDFTGDGRADILVVRPGRIILYALNFVTNRLDVVCDFSDNSITKDSQIQLGDFNGDGKLDLLIANQYSSYFYYSTGTNFERKNADRGFYCEPTGYNHDHNIVLENTGLRNYKTIICDDIDNDGKTDIIQISTNAQIAKNTPYSTYVGSIAGVLVMKNMGGGEFKSSSWDGDNYWAESLGITMYMYGDKMYFPIPFNLTPNRNFAFSKNNYRLGFFASGSIIEFELSHNTGRDKLLKEIKSDGLVTEIQYGQYGIDKQNLDFPHFQKFDTKKLQYPMAELNFLPNLSVVSRVRVFDGTNSLYQSFAYASPVVHFHGLGFIGFKGNVSTNWYDKPENMFKNIKEFDVLNRGLLKKESVILGTQWDKFIEVFVPGTGFRNKAYESITNYEYQTQVLTNKVFKPQLKKTTENNIGGVVFADSFVKETTNTYNEYNDITQQQIQYQRKFGLSMIGQPSFALEKTETIENTYAYGAANPNYFMSRLLKSKKIETATGESSFTTEDSYTYDEKGRVVEVLKKGNNTTETKTEKNTYDQYGNIVEKSLKAGNLPERKQTYKYGYYGRFLTEETDVEGLKTTYSYNGARGLLKEKKNAFGHVTKYTYNNWGEPLSVTDYLGKVTQTQYVKTGRGFEVITTNDEGNWNRNTFNAKGNKIQTATKDLQGQTVSRSYEYDAYNRVVKESEGYFGSTPSLWNETVYDKKGRVIKVKTSKGKEITKTYTLATIKENDGVMTKETKVNSLGQTIVQKDDGGEIKYVYFSNGNLKSANYDGVVVSQEQDGWGRKIKLIDPAAGVYTHVYNAYGELIKEGSPKGTTLFTLDNFGKLINKKITGDHTNTEINYTYDDESKQLTSSVADVSGTNYTYNYEYDTYRRLIKTTEITPVARFSKAVVFDDFGRALEETFGVQTHGKTGEKKIKHQYKNGYHWQTIDALTNQVLTSKAQVNAYGQLTKSNLGNGLEVTNVYDTYGYLQTNKVKKGTAELFTLANQFNAATSNLLSRTNGLFNRGEIFTYDNLDRLTSFTNKVGVQETQEYDDKGRIESNSIGAYGYSSGTSYQLESIELNAIAQPHYQLRPEQQIAYNAFKKPVWIKESGKENIYFDYNSDNQRSVMHYGDLATSKEQSSLKRYYSTDGNIEVNYNKTTNKVDFVFYLDGDAYSATVIAKGENTPEYYYLHRDYLGSILAITNNVGTIVEKRHFDAWGNVVFVKDGQNNDLSQLTFMDRGYTGHEHLEGVSLIQMNGRLYDPIVKRFLAPDNFIQDLSNTQNFNRYGYVLNNPLTYVDESGEIVGLVFGLRNLIRQSKNGEIRNLWDGVKAFGAGYIVGTIAGPNITAMEGGHATVGMLAGAITGIGTGDWSRFNNARRLGEGIFYLDGNRSFFGQVWQGISRFTFELPQTTAGHAFSQFKNMIYQVDRVEYFGGATFAMKENSRDQWGISLGNFIYASMYDEVKGDFKDYILTNPLLLHEYGHTFDSSKHGLSYLVSIGISSAQGAEWTERRANNFAAKYLKKYYNLDWKEKKFHLETDGHSAYPLE
ncbi:RHS repeat-associated core domain-containing protein [Myroides odoratus]|uniref:Cell wall-associated polypeptide CWBP200 n=1 Tax=Myroides odoratus TaxID=256 RepID=A0A378U2D4_MYROD|nr:RHS repeat-associated core domain-containing protein [Myroides odoratus]STZ69439.1 Cell wall-associated polypeptide CWBP200 [Myroides odoratus]